MSYPARAAFFCSSYLQILASELSDKLLAELLEMDAEMTITLHIQTVDQAAAVKSIKAKVSDIDKMKVEEHSLVPALQIFQESLCVVAARHKVGREYVHVIPSPGGFGG